MPIYDFVHAESGEIHSASMPWKDKDAYMKEHNLRSIFLTTPQVIGTSKDIYAKSSDAFKDKMSTIKKGYPSKGPNAHNMNVW